MCSDTRPGDRYLSCWVGKSGNTKAKGSWESLIGQIWDQGIDHFLFFLFVFIIIFKILLKVKWSRNWPFFISLTPRGYLWWHSVPGQEAEMAQTRNKEKH